MVRNDTVVFIYRSVASLAPDTHQRWDSAWGPHHSAPPTLLSGANAWVARTGCAHGLPPGPLLSTLSQPCPALSMCLGVACSSAHPGCENSLSRCWEGIWALIHIGLTDGWAGSFRSLAESGECTYYVTHPPGPGEEALFSSFYDEEEELWGVR